MIPTEHGDLSAGVDRHQASTVSDVDHVSHVIDDHDDRGTGARALRSNLLAGHGVLSTRLSNLDKVDEAPFTLFETTDDGLVRELGEVLVLHDEVV